MKDLSLAHAEAYLKFWNDLEEGTRQREEANKRDFLLDTLSPHMPKVNVQHYNNFGFIVVVESLYYSSSSQDFQRLLLEREEIFEYEGFRFQKINDFAVVALGAKRSQRQQMLEALQLSLLPF